MRSMEISRRRFVALLAAYGASSLGMSRARIAQASASALSEPASPLYLAARKNDGRFEAAVFDEQGTDRLVIPMPDRGHSFALDPARGRATVFGRQPGFFAIAFDVADKRPVQALQAAPGRHFFGHGVYSPDGKIMVATENDYEAGRGVLGIYDSSDQGQYRRIGEYASAGVGPHEVVLMPDGRTLCVANGGILTHPDYGKLQLNADTMQPSLAYLDMQTGKLLEQVFLKPEFNRLSIRHLVVDGLGAVWLGCQYTGAAQDGPPLVGRHRRGTPIQLFAGPEEVLRSMKNYVGSMAVNHAGTIVATSSPVGGKVLLWDAASGDFLASHDIFDGCGVAPATEHGFIVTSGQGMLASLLLHAEKKEIQQSATLSWDNHLRRF